MSRAYRELDGTVDNVGERIVSDYGSHFSCSSLVGSNCVSHLKDKLEHPAMVALGFTSDKLTIDLPEISVANDDGIARLLDDISGLGVYSNNDLTAGIYHTDKDLIKYVKDNKDRLEITEYRDRHENDRRINEGLDWRVAYKHTFIGLLDNYHTKGAFYSNTPNEFLFGLKPSKFLSRFVEKLIPGITERYALLFSEKHTLKVHITIDPNIMINCSESGTFSSCFEYDGEYHYSAQRFANADDSMMIVIFNEEGYILYRNWLFVNEDITSTIHLPGYTSVRGNGISVEVNKVARELIFGKDAEFKEANDIMGLSCHDDSYIDGYDSYVLKDSEGAWKGSNRCAYLGNAYSVEDGYDTGDANPQGHYCQCCDERHHADEMTYVTDQGDICEYCISEYYRYVESEGEWYHYEDVTMDVHGEYFFCDNISDNHIYCDHDGEWYPDGECTEAYDTGDLKHTDDLYYSEELDRYYECEYTMNDAEHEAREEEEV